MSERKLTIYGSIEMFYPGLRLRACSWPKVPWWRKVWLWVTGGRHLMVTRIDHENKVLTVRRCR